MSESSYPKNRTNNRSWIWIVVVAVALLFATVTCCLGGALGMMAGYRWGRHAESRSQVPEFDWEFPQVPEFPEIEPAPDLPELDFELDTPWLGVTYQMTDEGALIVAVDVGGPAEEAGVREGDVIIAVDGDSIAEGFPLVAHILQHKPGDTIELTILRDGDERTLEVTLGIRPTD